MADFYKEYMKVLCKGDEKFNENPIEVLTIGLKIYEKHVFRGNIMMFTMKIILNPRKEENESYNTRLKEDGFVLQKKIIVATKVIKENLEIKLSNICYPKNLFEMSGKPLLEKEVSDASLWKGLPIETEFILIFEIPKNCDMGQFFFKSDITVCHGHLDILNTAFAFFLEEETDDKRSDGQGNTSSKPGNNDTGVGRGHMNSNKTNVPQPNRDGIQFPVAHFSNPQNNRSGGSPHASSLYSFRSD